MHKNIQFNSKSILFFILCLSLSLFPGNSLTQDNIVIGIYTQKYIYDDYINKNPQSQTLTYILQTYVQLAHMSGTQVVPIFSYQSQSQILQILTRINGVIFTGGQQVIHINNKWTQNANFILKYAQKQNNEGKKFPILGICQGLELMLYLTSDKRDNFLDRIYNQTGVFNTIKFTQNTLNYKDQQQQDGKQQNQQQYYLLKDLSDETIQALNDPSSTKQGGITFFYHSWGILIDTFNNDKDLSGYWNVYATSVKNNQQFVTYLQAKNPNYPFYLIMFHPQRLAYDRKQSNQLVKGRIQLVNTISLNFMLKCRQSPNTYPKSTLQHSIIQNFQSYSSNRFPNSKVYLFHQPSIDKNNQQIIKQNSKGSLTQVFLIMLILCGGFFAVYKYYISCQKRRDQQMQNLNNIMRGNQFQLNNNNQRF